jgi:hypothetical protein
MSEELTQAEAQSLIDEAFDLERKIKASVGAMHAAWWELAETLYEFHDRKGWAKLGYETLGAFLGQPEIGMGESTFHRAVQMWRDLHVTRQLPKSELQEIEPSKAREVRPAIMAGDVEPEKAISDAKSLGYRDVVEKYRKQPGGRKPDDSEPLDASTEPERMNCPACGQYVEKESIDFGTLRAESSS